MIIQVVILILLIMGFLNFLIKEVLEIKFLKKILAKTIGKTTVDSLEDLIKIKNLLNKNISYTPELKTNRRPILRHTASQILKTNYGFCGENARVAIKLLLIGGMKARRIYLYGEKWQHVVLEHLMNNKLYMFDGHFDVKTKLEDKDVGSILSEDILSYPNGYEENSYVDFCRIKLFYKLPFLKNLSKIKIPFFLVYYFESPNLIKATFFLLIAISFFVI